MKLLIIEDELELSNSIVSYLKSESYSCEVAHTYASALKKIDAFEYDCILLDIGLPDGNGLNANPVVSRAESSVLQESSNGIEIQQKGAPFGTKSGSIAVPDIFELAELWPALRHRKNYSAIVVGAAIIRRKQFTGNNKLLFNEISVDTVSRQAEVNGEVVDLTRKEYQLLL